MFFARKRLGERGLAAVGNNIACAAAFPQSSKVPYPQYDTLHNQAASNSSETKAIAAAAPFTAAFST